MIGPVDTDEAGYAERDRATRELDQIERALERAKAGSEEARRGWTIPLEALGGADDDSALPDTSEREAT